MDSRRYGISPRVFNSKSLLMNENERMDTQNKNLKVRWRTQDENMR